MPVSIIGSPPGTAQPSPTESLAAKNATSTNKDDGLSQKEKIAANLGLKGPNTVTPTGDDLRALDIDLPKAPPKRIKPT